MTAQHNHQREGIAPTTTLPRVVVIGAGFGGLSAARALGNRPVDLTVVDRNNYHGFWPLLYQVATAGLEPEAIAHPVRGILRPYHNAHFAMAEVSGIDFERRLVLNDGDPIPYDYLILAAGSANNYFGNDALAEQTFGMKDLSDAERLRNHVLSAVEHAAREPDPERRAKLLTFMVIGGGPTGVELAGAFAELIQFVLRKDFRRLDFSQARVILIEAGPHILSPFPAELRQRALEQLQRMGVEVRLNTPVAAVEAQTVQFKDGSTIEAGTVVWAAGVRGAKLADHLPVEQGRGGRVKVTPFLHLPHRPEVFVIGDMAYLEGYKGNNPYPMVAPVAIQQGRFAARNILAQIGDLPLAEFRYFDKGQMATIGRSAAVLDSFGIQMSGFPAWVGWLFVHLLELIGFRNRAVVLANWAYNYVTYGGGVRLITSAERDSWYHAERDQLIQSPQ